MAVENSKANICLVLFLFINFVFSVKYLQRATPHFLVFSVVLTLCYFSLWKLRHLLAPIFRLRFLNIIVIVLFIVASGMLFKNIPVISLHVDRWSVITSFWDAYFKGDYVYFAQSNFGNPPGPMPFYFILALPFYLIGELGYFSLLGLPLFAFVLYYAKLTKSIRSSMLLLVAGSVFLLWEVICRSNLFFNGSLVLLSIIYLFTSIEQQQRYAILSNGILIGLVLSTRNVFVIPYLVAFLFILKFRLLTIAQIIQLGLVALLTFVLTFVPFVYNHMASFREMNPFLIQSGFLMPASYSIFCIVFSLFSYFLLKDKNDVYLYSGLVLFLTIILHFAYQISVSNFNEAFFGSRADISYFILSIPFLLFCLAKRSDQPTSSIV